MMAVPAIMEQAARWLTPNLSWLGLRCVNDEWGGRISPV